MTNVYSDEQKSQFRILADDAVKRLKDLGLQARVGVQNGLPYPSLREGAWTIAMLWDDAKGWSCPGYSQFPGPHWHWFLSSNLENFGVSYATGISKPLLLEPDNSALLSYVMRFVLTDPCRIPFAASTPNFQCPDCAGDWDIAQNEPGVFGKFLSPLVKLEVTPGSIDPEGWDPGTLSMAFDFKS